LDTVDGDVIVEIEYGEHSAEDYGIRGIVDALGNV
jgi:hypothetical protein